MVGKKTILTLVTIALLTLLAAGCSDDAKTTTAVDTVPPAVPTDLQASCASSYVALTWSPNVSDSDFAGFKVSRIFGGVTTMLVDTPVNITSYQDPAPGLGYNEYRVSAVDMVGNESAYATVGLTVNSNHVYAPEQH